jgi:hypothetical protein
MALGFEMRDVPHRIKHKIRCKGMSGVGTTRKTKTTRNAKGVDRHYQAVTARSMDCQTPPGQWAGEPQVRELAEQQRRSEERYLRADGRGSNSNNGMTKNERAKLGMRRCR